MKRFDFSRLINTYSVECLLLSESVSGSYIGGEWVPGAEAVSESIKGAVIPMTAHKLYQSGGTYTEQDREFITYKEISLEPSHFIVYKGLKYQVLENTDYSDYAGFYAYNLKRVGAFDRPEGNK